MSPEGESVGMHGFWGWQMDTSRADDVTGVKNISLSFSSINNKAQSELAYIIGYGCAVHAANVR